MKTKQISHSVLLLGFFAMSCSAFEENKTLTQVLSTKSFVDSEYALSEKEAAIKAEQFLFGIKNSKQGDGEICSTLTMNLSEKELQIETIIRYIEYKRDEINSYEQIPVYVINYHSKKNKEAGGYIILAGDKRIKNNILVYSDAGSWDNENLSAQSFLYWFWTNVDKQIASELEGSSLYPTTKSNIPPDCLHYYSSYVYTLTEKRLPQLTQWHQNSPFGNKLAPICNFYLYGSMYPLVGCVAVAMGQIMAHHKKPTNSSYINWLGTMVSTTYNWTNMLTSPDINNLNPTYQEQIQHLMAEIGRRVDMQYNCNPVIGSNPSNMNNIVTAFRAMGYSISNSHIYFYHNTVAFEINANRPVFAADINHQTTSVFYEHAWMIDGHSTIRQVDTITVYCPQMQPYEIITMDDTYYVHCNLGYGVTSGWGYTGYYNSSMFAYSITGIFTNIQ